MQKLELMSILMNCRRLTHIQPPTMIKRKKKKKKEEDRKQKFTSGKHLGFFQLAS